MTLNDKFQKIYKHSADRKLIITKKTHAACSILNPGDVIEIERMLSSGRVKIRVFFNKRDIYHCDDIGKTLLAKGDPVYADTEQGKLISLLLS